MQQKKQPNWSNDKQVKKNEILYQQIQDKIDTNAQNFVEEFNKIEQQLIKFQEQRDQYQLKGKLLKLQICNTKISDATMIKEKLYEKLNKAKQFQKVLQIQIDNLKMINQINPQQIESEERFANLQILNDIQMEIENQINQQIDKGILILLNKLLKYVEKAKLNYQGDFDKDFIEVQNNQNENNYFDQFHDLSENSENDDDSLMEDVMNELQKKEKKQQLKSELLKVQIKKKYALKRLKEIEEEINVPKKEYLSKHQYIEKKLKLKEQQKWQLKEILNLKVEMNKILSKYQRLKKNKANKQKRKLNPKIINEEIFNYEQVLGDENKIIDELLEFFIEEQNFLCQICGKNQNQYVPLPCKHFICCDICFQKQRKTCEICDQPIQKMIKIFH